MLFWFVKHTLMVGAYQKGYRCFMTLMFYIFVQYSYWLDIEKCNEKDYFHCDDQCISCRMLSKLPFGIEYKFLNVCI